MSRAATKGGWTRVAFGDVVEKVDDSGVPTIEECRTYIGLEHLDPDSFTIRRWGSEVVIKVPKTRVRKGDVLFARRNTHLRRCAISPFDAYFSPDGYAFRSRSPLLLHDLLLYIVAGDAFMNFAIKHSAGTHSKRVKWSDLMHYEFALPPLAEQRRIAEALLSLEATRNSLSELATALRTCYRSVIAGAIEQAKEVGQPILLGNIASINYGLTIDPSRRNRPRQIPYLRVGNVRRGVINISELKTAGEKDGDDMYRLEKGDLLVVEGHADAMEVGRAAVWEGASSPMYHQNHLIRVRCGSAVIPEYLCLALNSDHGRSYFRTRAKSTSGLHTLNSTVVKEYALPLPGLSTQMDLLKKTRQVGEVLQDIAARESIYDRMKLALVARLGSGTA